LLQRSSTGISEIGVGKTINRIAHRYWDLEADLTRLIAEAENAQRDADQAKQAAKETRAAAREAAKHAQLDLFA